MDGNVDGKEGGGGGGGRGRITMVDMNGELSTYLFFYCDLCPWTDFLISSVHYRHLSWLTSAMEQKRWQGELFSHDFFLQS
jgi:hypothetical protein